MPYWPTDKRKVPPDIINFGVIKGIEKTYFTIKSSLELSSDHSPIIINVCNKIVKKMQPVLHNKRTNWILFREQVKTTLNTQIPLKDQYDIIQAVEHFNSSIQQATWNSTPSGDTMEPYFTTSTTIRDKLKEKHKLRK